MLQSYNDNRPMIRNCSSDTNDDIVFHVSYFCMNCVQKTSRLHIGLLTSRTKHQFRLYSFEKCYSYKPICLNCYIDLFGKRKEQFLELRGRHGY